MLAATLYAKCGSREFTVTRFRKRSAVDSFVRNHRGPTMLDGNSSQPANGVALSSFEIEHFFPYATPIIHRGSWTFGEMADVNGKAARLGEHRRTDFNNIFRYYFRHRDHAAELSEYALSRRLHRLKFNSTRGASREEVALEWERMEAE
jgi:hypothetical protein